MKMNLKIIAIITVAVIAVVAAALFATTSAPQPPAQQPGPPATTPTAQPPAQTSPATTPAQPSTPTATPQQTTTPALRGAVTGGGSTFVNPQMVMWSKKFYEATGGAITVNYQSIGSGAGAAQFLEKKLDFGASDVPMPRDRYKQVAGRFVQFPVVIGSIVLVYNIPEITYVKTGKYLNLTSELISLIYMGEIKQWCDPRIKAVNPGLADKLPCRDIIAVHRSDGSGTTAAFTLYLSLAYKPWNETVGWGYTVKWPADEKAQGSGAKGNEGVAQAVLQNAYSIGYVEFAYWYKNRDKYDKVGGVAYLKNDNDGKFYFPTAESVGEGAKAGLERYTQKYGAKPKPDADWNPVSIEFTNPPRGYPILAFTYVFLWKDYAAEGYGDAAAKAALLKRFFEWVLTEGQKPEYIVEGFIPLPREVAQIGLDALKLVKP
ncbi:MAG: phosphate ABC transporter substrate-binding protein PstS [Pyrobaculum sp.]